MKFWKIGKEEKSGKKGKIGKKMGKIGKDLKKPGKDLKKPGKNWVESWKSLGKIKSLKFKIPRDFHFKFHIKFHTSSHAGRRVTGAVLWMFFC